MEEDEVVSVKHWILIIIVSGIPILNLIIFIYWAAFPPLDINKNKKNYAAAMLMISAVLYAISLIGWLAGKF
ncbi:MAG: hypothetical protein ACPGF8_00085 [Opitutales bacterium]